MREPSTYFRKPVSFQVFHVLLVKQGKFWEYDSSAWDHSLMLHSFNEAKKEYGPNNVKLITSPSDDETVLARIIKEMNK